jgi:hypothetical protein
MCCAGGLGGFAQGFQPQALTVGVFPRWVFPHAILTHVEAQKVKPRLVAIQGMADATFGGIQGQSEVREPGEEQRLTVLENLATPISAERNSATIWDETAQFLPRKSEALRRQG